MRIVISVILLILFIVILIAAILIHRLLYPKVRNEQQTYEREISRKRFPDEFYQSLGKKEFQLKSRLGYQLSCMVLDNEITKQKENQRKVAVFCHGYKCCKMSEVVYAKILMELGFTAVLYDHRNHGKSGKKFTSMGYYEKEDLHQVVNWCYETYGQDIRICLHGESMGATTVLSYLAMDERIAVAIADCPYSDLKSLVRHQLKHIYHLPVQPFLAVGNLLMKLRAGFWLSDVSAVPGASYSKTPILFIHGDMDFYVPYQMSEQMFTQRKGSKEIYMAKGAKHAMACNVDLAKYASVVRNFIDTYWK